MISLSSPQAIGVPSGNRRTQHLCLTLVPLPRRMKVFVPTGFSAFPSEIRHAPEKWVKVKYPKLISYSYMERGGHFAAFEEPKLLAQDIRKFVSLAELQ